MRCLLDENLSPKPRHCLGDREIVSAVYAGFGGLKNGKLLDAVEAAGFEVLITADKTLQYEQNLKGRRLAIVSQSANSWTIVEPYAVRILMAVDAAEPGSFVRRHSLAGLGREVACGGAGHYSFLRAEKPSHELLYLFQLRRKEGRRAHSDGDRVKSRR